MECTCFSPLWCIVPHTYTHTCLHTHMHTHMHNMHTHMHTHIHTHIHTYAYTHMPAHTHAHTCTHTYTHIHAIHCTSYANSDLTSISELSPLEQKLQPFKEIDARSMLTLGPEMPSECVPTIEQLVTGRSFLLVGSY